MNTNQPTQPTPKEITREFMTNIGYELESGEGYAMWFKSIDMATDYQYGASIDLVREEVMKLEGPWQSQFDDCLQGTFRQQNKMCHELTALDWAQCYNQVVKGGNK